MLRPFISTMEFRAGNRYFVIRESRSVTAMKFLLTEEQLGEIGGGGVVDAAGGTGVESFRGACRIFGVDAGLSRAAGCYVPPGGDRSGKGGACGRR